MIGNIHGVIEIAVADAADVSRFCPNNVSHGDPLIANEKEISHGRVSWQTF
jgi:hypothetical protein